MANDKTIEEIRAERDARKAALAKSKASREETELRELNRLEVEHGDENVMAVHTIGGMVVISRPKPGPMARWREMMWCEKVKPGERAAVKARAAADLAKTCVIYPESGAYAALVDQYPGVADAVGAAAVKFAGIIEEDEGKG